MRRRPRLGPRDHRSGHRRVGTGSARRLFVLYAAASLIPVLLLGVVLLARLNAQADASGLSQGRAAAELVARTGIAPLLEGNDLRRGPSAAERLALRRSVSLVVQDGQVLRLRLRTLDGKVIFSDDDSTDTGPDDEALKAAGGQTVSELTRLNADDGLGGPRVIEVYEPLESAQSGVRIGVLELYVPYAPIAAEIDRGQRTVIATLSAGLLVLWLVLLAISASVTGRLRRVARVNARMAREDLLTGLPNRTQFTERVDAAIAASTSRVPAAVAVINLDRFRQINDTLGRDKGDQVLVRLAERLAHSIGPADTLARLGGDEFGLVLGEVQGVVDAQDRLGALRQVLAEPLEIDGLPLAVEASVGFAVAPHDGTDFSRLAQRAELAMYEAKEKHLGVVAYRPEQDPQNRSALGLVAELGAAIAADQLVLHYQPKIDLGSGRVTSVEALVRWQHPTMGLLYPDTFLPAVEQTELIEPLTWWVVRTATLALAAIDPAATMGVAVNISARSLTRPDFADDLLAVLSGTDTEPHRVILEVTETMLLADPPRAAATLTRLHDAGFGISIDDFGAGQTSLGYLAMLPIDELKIDKAFVLSMLLDPRTATIVRSIVELGHGLGFTVTAEGVETVEMLQRLRALDCDTAQGYLLARPMPLADLHRHLAAHAVDLRTGVGPASAVSARSS